MNNKTLEEEINDRVPGLMLSQRQVLAKMFQSFAEKIRESVVGEEWKRCVDLLDTDHSKCVIKESCIGYQNAQSDLMNQPPLLAQLKK